MAAELAGQLVEVSAHLILTAWRSTNDRASLSCSASGISVVISAER